MPYYISNYSEDRSQNLYNAVLALLKDEGLFRKPELTAKAVAERLDGSPSAIGAAIAYKTDSNFSRLLARLRVHEACFMLRNRKYDDLTAEEIGLRAGFASRQTFYNCFSREMIMTPRQYRKASAEEREKVDRMLRIHL